MKLSNEECFVRQNPRSLRIRYWTWFPGRSPRTIEGRRFLSNTSETPADAERPVRLGPQGLGGGDWEPVTEAGALNTSAAEPRVHHSYISLICCFQAGSSYISGAFQLWGCQSSTASVEVDKDIAWTCAAVRAPAQLDFFRRRKPETR